MRILITNLLFVACLSTPVVAEEPETPTEAPGVVFIYQGDQSIEAYVRKHRCMVGWWYLDKKTEYGWIGKLAYYSTNDDPRGKIYISKQLKILRPKEGSVPLGSPDYSVPPHECLIVVHPAERKGYYTLVAHWGPKSAARPERWWPGQLGFDWEQTGDRRFCYHGLLDEGLELLTHPKSYERSWGAQLLGTLGKDALPAEAALIQLLQDKNKEVRFQSAVALAKIGGPGASQTLPIFMELLEPKHKADRFWGFTGLRCLGPTAAKAAPQLIPLLEDDGYNALETLIVIAPEDAQVQEAIRRWRATLRPYDFKWTEEMFERLEYNPRQQPAPPKPEHTSSN